MINSKRHRVVKSISLAFPNEMAKLLTDMLDAHRLFEDAPRRSINALKEIQPSAVYELGERDRFHHGLTCTQNLIGLGSQNVPAI